MRKPYNITHPSLIDTCRFPPGFFKWMNENWHIWERFDQHAHAMAAHRERYSARTIVEVMRWNSDIREKEPLFKISNNMVPGLARYWMALNGWKHPKFFAVRW